MEPWILQLGGMMIAAAVTWGAIRADIRHIHEQVKEAKQRADAAHSRIDDFYQRRMNP